MLEFLVLVLVCLLGFDGGGPWIILIGTIRLCIGPFYNQWKMLKGRSSVPFDRKIAMFFLGRGGQRDIYERLGVLL